METLTIKCPNCQQQIGIRNNSDKDKIEIKCPHCSKPITVVLRKKPVQMAGAPATPNPNPAPAAATVSDGGETQTGLDMMNGEPVLIFKGTEYPLQVGRNTVGRGSATSMATIKLPSDDRYMSRVNAVINVKKLQNGTNYVTVSSINGNNLVQVNGKAVDLGERTVLLNGYILTLGNTQVVFSLKQKR